jgi:hypothetical protein
MKAIFAAALRSPKARPLFLLLTLFPAGPADATDNYDYRDDEYAIVSGGRSPDGRWSIAAHGGGEYGYDDFDLYLMREPTHEKLAPLRMGQDALDTGPVSIVGLWAPDSRHVAVFNRSDRHVLDLRLFAVGAGKLQSIDVPSLASVIGRSHLKPGVHHELFSRLYRITWQKPDRIALEEFDGFDAAKPIVNAGLEAYLTVDRRGPERTFTDFSAKAVCKITEKGELRFISVKPQPKWPGTIVYSPHLLYDRELGLHDTETTMSSLAAPKKDPQ